MKIKSAKGLKGLLLWDGEENYYFRVYDKKDKSKFRDYDIFHSDLEITITDDDCYTYEDPKSASYVLDYGLETLGKK